MYLAASGLGLRLDFQPVVSGEWVLCNFDVFDTTRSKA